MHRGLPCSDEMTGSGSTTPTSGPEIHWRQLFFGGLLGNTYFLETEDYTRVWHASTRCGDKHDAWWWYDMINDLSTTSLHDTVANQQNSLTNRNYIKQQFYFLKNMLIMSSTK
jgi:hypothetical protein